MHFAGDQTEYITTAPAYQQGKRLNLGAGHNPIQGFDNLDKVTGWLFEHGLADYANDEVEAVTISHALMYVPLEFWPLVFSEIARVLEPGGVVRVTEDAIAEGESTRREIRPNAEVATGSVLVLDYLRRANLHPYPVTPNTSSFFDRTLIQSNYGEPPDVFHVEGIKP